MPVLPERRSQSDGEGNAPEPPALRRASSTHFACTDVMETSILPLVHSGFNALSAHRTTVRLVISDYDSLG